VCPDSAVSRKSHPQKTGAVKPGHIQNHYREESVLSDALKVTSPLILKDCSGSDRPLDLRGIQPQPAPNDQVVSEFFTGSKSPGVLFQ